MLFEPVANVPAGGEEEPFLIGRDGHELVTHVTIGLGSHPSPQHDQMPRKWSELAREVIEVVPTLREKERGAPVYESSRRSGSSRADGTASRAGVRDEPRLRLGSHRLSRRTKGRELIAKRSDSGFRRNTLRFDPLELRLCFREFSDQRVPRCGGRVSGWR